MFLKLGGINSKSIEKIISEFPNINLHWLITGEQKTTAAIQNIVMEAPSE